VPAPTVVQHNSGFSNGTTTLSVSFGSAVTAGNMLLVWIGINQSNSISTVTMTGETLTKVTGASNAGTAGNGATALYAENGAAGGQTQVTVTTSGSDDIHVHIIEVHGQSGSPQDATGNTESATLSVSTSASTTTANDLVVAFFWDFHTAASLTAGGSYSLIDLSQNNTGGDSALTESKTVSATGVQTATAGGNGTDVCEQGIIAIAGTGGGAVTLYSIPLTGAGQA
jgi:hypothetical protein